MVTADADVSSEYQTDLSIDPQCRIRIRDTAESVTVIKPMQNGCVHYSMMKRVNSDVSYIPQSARDKVIEQLRLKPLKKGFTCVAGLKEVWI